MNFLLSAILKRAILFQYTLFCWLVLFLLLFHILPHLFSPMYCCLYVITFTQKYSITKLLTQHCSFLWYTIKIDMLILAYLCDWNILSSFYDFLLFIHKIFLFFPNFLLIYNNHMPVYTDFHIQIFTILLQPSIWLCSKGFFEPHIQPMFFFTPKAVAKWNCGSSLHKEIL